MANTVKKKSKGHPAGLIQNLPISDEEKHALHVKAGQAAAEVHRRKKNMREVARAILDAELTTDDEIRQAMADRGFETTEGAAVLYAQLARARKGDVEAARFLRDTSGQKPVEGVAIGNLDDKPFETIDLSKLTDAQLKSFICDAQAEAETPGG